MKRKVLIAIVLTGLTSIGVLVGYQILAFALGSPEFPPDKFAPMKYVPGQLPDSAAKQFLNDYASMGLQAMQKKYSGKWLVTPGVPNRGFIARYDGCQVDGSGWRCTGVLKYDESRSELGQYELSVSKKGHVRRFGVYQYH